MVGETVWTLVDPRTAGPEFWKRYHEFRRARQKATRPDDPVRPDQVEERRMRYQDPFHIEFRYEISVDGLMLSWFYGHTPRPGTSEYEKNKHLFWADAYVLLDHRRTRIGATWLPLVLDLVDRHGCTTVGMGTEEDGGHAFLKWTGADVKLVEAENRLRLADVDWGMLQGWVAAGRKRSPETAVEIFDGPMPESMWVDFAPQMMTMLNTMPFESLDIGEIIVTPDHLREFYERLKVAGEDVHMVLAREPDGTVSAVTEATWAPHRETIIQQMFTGVRPDARGRGLGKWIKAAMLLHLHELYPRAQWVSTDNAGSNAPMLAINKKVGFKQYRAASAYQISRDRLAARVRSLGSA